MIPLLFNLNTKRILVVGGGTVATRRIETLLENDGTVFCVSPSFTKKLCEKTESRLILIKKNYDSQQLSGMDLVIAATNDKEINAQVKKECKACKIACHRVDDPKDSDFIFPGVLRQGALSIAVCTEGASPCLTKEILKELSEKYDDTYQEKTALLKIYRQNILKNKSDPLLLKAAAKCSNEELKQRIKKLGEK